VGMSHTFGDHDVMNATLREMLQEARRVCVCVCVCVGMGVRVCGLCVVYAKKTVVLDRCMHWWRVYELLY
jgi:hypothetical protein